MAVLFFAAPIVSASDGFPPAISVWHSPSAPTPATPVEIRAHALDASGISLIEINYWISGAPGSKQCTYTTECVASLGTMAQGTQGRYSARARDTYGNWGETDSYYFTVGQPAPGRGDLDQYVADCRTAAPIFNALVEAAGKSGRTNGNGHALIAGLDAAPVAVIASASGYNPRAFNADIAAGRTNYYTTCLNAVNADSTPPVVSAARTPPGQVTPYDNVELSASAIDASPIAWTAVKYKLGAGQWQSVACNSDYCVAQLGRLAQGVTVEFYGSGQDVFGNIGSSGRQFFTVAPTSSPTPTPTPGGDTTPPALSLSRVPSGAVTDGQSVAFQATASDASGIAFTRIWVKVAGGDFVPTTCNSNACAASTGALSQGTQVFYWGQARDNAGNEASTPVFTFTVGSNGASTGSVFVNAFDCDSSLPIANAIVSIDAVRGSTDGSGGALLAGINAGTATLNFAAANYHPSSKQVTVVAGQTVYESICGISSGNDTTAPTVTASRVPAGDITTGQAVAIMASAFDESGILWTQANYRIDNGALVTSTCFASSCATQAGPFANGAVVEFFGIAKDAFGNVGRSASQYFTVGASGPTPTPTPTPGGQCSVLLASPNTPANEPVDVIVSYSQVRSHPPSAAIDCGNGFFANALCFATGPQEGLCIGECTYPQNGIYSIGATEGPNSCSPASISVSSGGPTPTPTPSATPTPSPTPTPYTGTLVIRAADSTTGGPVRNALATITQSEFQTEAFTNSLGEARFVLNAGNYSVSLTAAGYSGASGSAIVRADQTNIRTFLMGGSTGGACGTSAQLISTPACSGDFMSFKLRINNRFGGQRTIYFNYTSGFALDLPDTYQINTSDTQIIFNVSSHIGTFIGEQPPVSIIMTDEQGCQSHVTVPVCTPRGISVQTADYPPVAFPATQACTEITVRNFEKAEQQVTLDSYGFYDKSFSQNTFVIGALAAKRIDFCVNFPASADGLSTYQIVARAPAGNFTAYAYFQVAGKTSFSNQPASCLTIPPTGSQVIEINFTNRAIGGNYKLEISESDPGIEAAATQPLFYNFVPGSVRTTYLTVATQGLLAGNHSVLLSIRDMPTNAVVYSKELCLFAPVTLGAKTYVQPNGLLLAAGGDGTTAITVENTGNAFTHYEITTDSPQEVGFDVRSMDLAPGDSGLLALKINTASGTPPGIREARLYLAATGANHALNLQAESLKFTVVSPEDYRKRTILKGIAVEQAEAGIEQNGAGSISVRVTNNNAYPVSLDVYATNLPPGVTATPQQQVQLSAFEDKVVFLQAQSRNAPAGSFNSILKASNAFENGQAPLRMHVGVPLPPNLGITVSDPAYSFRPNAVDVTFTAAVANGETGPIELAAALLGIPNNWNYSIKPASATIEPGNTAAFEVAATAPRAKLADANASLSFLASDGRHKDVAVGITPLRASGLSGFFILGLFSDPLLLALFTLFILFGIGLAFYSRDLLERVRHASGGK